MNGPHLLDNTGGGPASARRNARSATTLPDQRSRPGRAGHTRGLRLLILSPDYTTEPGGERLLQELAEELCGRGHSVDLLVLDSSGTVPPGELPGKVERLRALQVPGWERSLASRSGPLKYLPQAARLRLDPRVTRFLAHHYDGCIFATPGVIAGGLPGYLKRRNRLGISVMIMWDFFPVTNVEIGALPGGWFSRALYRMERAIVLTQDAFAFMTPRGQDFLRDYYGEVPAATAIIPPWGTDRSPDGATPSKRERFTIAWGGQITHGRALDDLIHVVAQPEVVASGAELLIAGDGPARTGYEDLARSLEADNIHFVGPLSRTDYTALLRTCHVGASFMSQMSVPSFPSKAVDYCRVGLPVLAAVESGTDFGEILESAGAGVAVPSGDRAAITRAVLDLATPAASGRVEDMGAAARLFFETELDVRVAADRFEILLGAA